MIRLMTFSGLLAAVAFVAVILATTSPSGSVQAREEGSNCRTVQMAADQGYGVSQTITRHLCE